jgi:hypothetical protein
MDERLEAVGVLLKKVVVDEEWRKLLVAGGVWSGFETLCCCC